MSRHFLVLFSFLLLLPGCALYRSQQLPQLVEKSHDTHANTVELRYKVFDTADCRHFLGRSIGKKLFKKGYQPVQLALINRSNRSFDVALSSVTWPTVAPEVVASSVSRSKVGGFLVALAIPGIGQEVAVTLCWPLGLAVWGGGFIGLAIHEVLFRNANKAKYEDYLIKAFPEDTLLTPGRTITGVVFVPMQDFSPDFSFVLRDSKSGERITLSSTIPSVTFEPINKG